MKSRKMGTLDWIRNKFEEFGYEKESKYKIYALFDSFKEDLNSNIGIDSFKRMVRMIYNQNKSDGSSEENFSESTHGNNRILTYKGPRILTQDQLLEACDVDLEDWNVDKYVVNKWEISRKNKITSLSWDNGVMNGYTDDKGNFNVEPLFQVKIWLTKKVLQKCFLPELKTISINENKKDFSSKCSSKEKKNKSTVSAIILADAQMGFVRDFRTGKIFPLHDRKVFSIAQYVIKVSQPDYLILNGDFFDLTQLTDKFLNTPEYYNVLQPAFLEFVWWILLYKKACPSMKIIYIAGNHEERLQKQILKYVPFVYGLKSADRIDNHEILSIPNLAGFDDLGIEWINDYKNGSSYWIGDIEITHGLKANGKSGATVTNIINSATHSQIVGHTHRFEHAEKTINNNGHRKEIAVWSFGTMGRVDGIVPSSHGYMNWQQGFGKLIYDVNFKNYTITPIRVNLGRCLYDGEIIAGTDPCDNIAMDVNWPSIDISNEEENFSQINFT